MDLELKEGAAVLLEWISPREINTGKIRARLPESLCIVLDDEPNDEDGYLFEWNAHHERFFEVNNMRDPVKITPVYS